MTIEWGSTARDVILIGVAGSGKSTVGQLLAGETTAICIDVDAQVEAELGATVGQLIVGGDSRFAQKRQEIALAALKDLHLPSPYARIIVLGSSQVHDPDVVSMLRQVSTASCILIELTASLSAVIKREGMTAAHPVALGTPRAILNAMMTDHHEASQALDAYQIDTTDLSAQDVARQIARMCRMSAI